ncbi:MAG TPA: DNA/RNA non-specific endonuclease, partial [Verrucomicrobiae bacterium]|nr:DNA/RNA non-specific endonuclease [Verrucomicrobiae bacterium]
MVTTAALLLALRAPAIIDVSLQMQLGNPSGATADTNNFNHYLLVRSVEAIDYNNNLGVPNWASWDLTSNDVGSVSRSTSFYVDTNLPPNFDRLSENDYNGVGTNLFD